MNKRFVVTTALGLVLTTTAFAQSPNERSRTQNQPSATTTPSTSQSAPATGTTSQSSAPNTSTTATGTAPNQSSQPANPSAAQTTPSTQQPAQNQAQNPATATQPGTAQTPAPATQPDTAQAPAPATQPSTAQTPAPTTQPSTAQTPAPAAQPGTAQAPSSNTSVNASANIGVQEQTRIRQSIAQLNVQPLTNVNFSVAVGTVVPRNVRLQPVPSDIVAIVPQYRNHSFVVVRDEIVIVEPSTYRIVAVLPRSGGSTAAAPAPAQKKLKFTNREREVIRTHTRSSREPVTTGSSARAQVRIGDRVPDTVELREFPETVYRTVPSVREYRYMQMENRSYLVEPRQRTIIEEID